MKPLLIEMGCDVVGVACTDEDARRCASGSWARGIPSGDRLAVFIARGFGVAGSSLLPPDDSSRALLSSGMSEACLAAMRKAELDTCVVVHAPWGAPLYVDRDFAGALKKHNRRFFKGDPVYADVEGVVAEWMASVRRAMDEVNAVLEDVRAAVRGLDADVDVEPILEDVGSLWTHPEDSPTEGPYPKRTTIVVATNWRSLRWFELDLARARDPAEEEASPPPPTLRCALVRSDDFVRWIPYEPEKGVSMSDLEALLS